VLRAYFQKNAGLIWSDALPELGFMLLSRGPIIGIPTTQVRSSGRATQGVRLIKFNDKDRVCSFAKVRES
jgi:DNA gyrase/topoisomerase IV subunit A